MEVVPVFQVTQIEQKGYNEWAVAGRAWQDIRVGDTVRLVQPQVEEQEQWPSFEVVAISAFGEQLEELFRITPGILRLSGAAGRRISSHDMLAVFREPAS